MSVSAEASAAYVAREPGVYFAPVHTGSGVFAGFEILRVVGPSEPIHWIGWIPHYHRATASRMARRRARPCRGEISREAREK